MKTLIKNIKELIQVREEGADMVAGADMGKLPSLKDAYLLIEDGLIADYGPMQKCPSSSQAHQIDASGKLLLPAWCDSHTHIVYTGNREQEFVDRIKGLTYEEIAQKGGGILNSARQLEKVSEDQLYAESKARLEEVLSLGTGAMEIKSGYGLTVEAELKMLKDHPPLKARLSHTHQSYFFGSPCCAGFL
jgi:imidazolonepropionase